MQDVGEEEEVAATIWIFWNPCNLTSWNTAVGSLILSTVHKNSIMSKNYSFFPDRNFSVGYKNA